MHTLNALEVKMNIDLDKLHEYAFKRPTGRCMGKSFYAEMQIASLLIVDGPKTIFTVLSFHRDIMLTIKSVVRILDGWGIDNIKIELLK